MRLAIIQIPSIAIDGPSMIDAHRKKLPIDGIEWSLSTGVVSVVYVLHSHFVNPLF